jgi:hypothetical protein
MLITMLWWRQLPSNTTFHISATSAEQLNSQTMILFFYTIWMLSRGLIVCICLGSFGKYPVLLKPLMAKWVLPSCPLNVLVKTINCRRWSYKILLDVSCTGVTKQHFDTRCIYPNSVLVRLVL